MPFFKSGQGNGARDKSRSQRQVHEGRRRIDGAVATFSFAQYGELVSARGDVAIRIQREGRFVLTLRDFNFTLRVHARRTPDHQHADGSFESLLALGHDLEVEDAICDHWHRGLDHFQCVGRFLNHCYRQLVDLLRVVNCVSTANHVEHLGKAAINLLVGIGGLELDRHGGTGQRCVWIGLKEQWETSLIAGNHRREQLHSGGHVRKFKGHVTRGVVAGDVHQRGITVASRHSNELALVAVIDTIVRRGNRDIRHRRDAFDAVNKVGTTTTKMVRDGEAIDVVGRSSEGELAVEAPATASVIVASDAAAFGIVDRHDRVERRTQSLTVAEEVHLLAFGEFELEEIHITSLLDDAVQCHRGYHPTVSCVSEVIVGFNFHRVVEGADAHVISRRCRIILQEDHVVGVRSCWKLNFLLRKGAITVDEFHLLLGANLATRWEADIRATKAAHMEPVMRVASAAIGGFTDLDHVVAIRRGNVGKIAVLLVEDGIVTDGKLKTLAVQHSHIRVKGHIAEPHAFDFQADALALLGCKLVVIDILVPSDAFNGLIETDRLRSIKIVVRLLLLQARIGPDLDGPHEGETTLGPDPKHVSAKGDIWRHHERRINFGLGHFVHRLQGEAG